MLISATKELWGNITRYLIKNRYSISVMESCTSGLVATFITNEPGASAIMKGAFVTYSNEAKVLQGVDAGIIEKYGVYSEETATAMAKACQKAYNAYIGIGVTGVLDRIDPANVTEQKNIYYAVCYGDKTKVSTLFIPDDITDRFNRKLVVTRDIGLTLSEIIHNENL